MDGSVVFKKADDVNVTFINANKEAPYKSGEVISEFVTSESNQFVRFYTDGTTAPDGRWLVKLSDVQNMSPSQIKDYLSLPHLSTHRVDVAIPAGTRLRAGEAANILDFGTNRGAIQFEIPYPDGYSTSWFSNNRGF